MKIIPLALIVAENTIILVHKVGLRSKTHVVAEFTKIMVHIVRKSLSSNRKILHYVYFTRTESISLTALLKFFMF